MSFKGMLGGIFHLYSNLKEHISEANSGHPDQTPQNATSDLGLHCLPIPPLKGI